MKIRELLFIFSLCFVLISCGPKPPSETIIKECMVKGWKPYYYSSPLVTHYKCLPPDDFSAAPFDYRKYMYKKNEYESSTLQQ